MSDEKLIEEARRAYLDAWAATNLEDVPPGTRSRNGIIAALAVFEKAHARGEWEYAIRDTAADELITEPQPTTDGILPLSEGEVLERRRKASAWEPADARMVDMSKVHPLRVVLKVAPEEEGDA